MVGFASAFEFDNIKDYNESTRTIEVRNSILGIPFLQLDKVAEIKLNSPLEVKVSRGYRKVAEFEIKAYSEYDNVLKELELFNIRKGDLRFTRDYDYKVRSYENITVDDYGTGITGRNPNGTESYGSIIIGNHIEQKEMWTKLDIINLKDGEVITVGIFTNVKARDRVEWIQNMFGVRIDEWAIWFEPDAITETIGVALINSSSTALSLRGVNFTIGDQNLVLINVTIDPDTDTNGTAVLVNGIGAVGGRTVDSGGPITNLVASATFVGTTATFSTAPIVNATLVAGQSYAILVWANGDVNFASTSFPIVGTFLNWTKGVFNGAQTQNNEVSEIMSISVAPTFAGPLVILNAPIDNFNSSNETIIFNVTVSFSDAIANVTLFIDGGSNETNSSGFDGDYIFTKILSEGNHNWSISATGVFGNISNSSIRNLNIDIGPPLIIIESPIGTLEINSIGRNETLNVTFTDGNLDTCWFDYNGTNITIEGCLSGIKNSTQFILEDGNFNLTVYANDTFGNESPNFTSWEYTVLIVSETFNTQTTETNLETFIINIDYDIVEFTNIVANLIYNGTNFLATDVVTSGNNATYTKAITIPLVPADVNVSFHWSFDLTNTTGTFTFNSTTNNQTILNVGLDDCSTNTIRILNYTLVDEEDQLPLTIPTDNGTIELDISIFSVDGLLQTTNFSVLVTDTNNASVCITDEALNSSTYSLFAIARYSGLDYSTEYHHIQNLTLNNETGTQNITLYDLLSTDATVFRIIYKDSSFLTLSNAVIQVQRQYVSEGVFKTVEAPLTSSEGDTVAHLVKDDVKYNFVVLKNGVILSTFENLIAFCEDIISENCLITLNAVSGSGRVFDYDDTIKIAHSINYNETTRLLSVIFSTLDGTSKTVTFEAFKIDELGTTTVCNNTLTSSSGTLSCTVPLSLGNETIYYTLTVDETEVFTGYFSLTDPLDLGDAGLFLLLFLLLMIPFMFVASKSLTILSVGLTYVIAILFAFIQGTILAGGGAIMFITIASMILIHKLNSEGRS